MKKYIIVLICFIILLSILSGCASKKTVDPRELEISSLMENLKYDEAREKANELFVGDEKKLKKEMEIINEREKNHKQAEIRIKQLDENIKKNDQEIADIIKSWDIINNKANILEIQPGHNPKIKGNYIYITGSVKNIGDKDISYFEVIAKFLDGNNQVLDSDYTNDSLVLNPGEMREFEIMHKWNAKYESYELSIGRVR